MENNQLLFTQLNIQLAVVGTSLNKHITAQPNLSPEIHVLYHFMHQVAAQTNISPPRPAEGKEALQSALEEIMTDETISLFSTGLEMVNITTKASRDIGCCRHLVGTKADEQNPFPQSFHE